MNILKKEKSFSKKIIKRKLLQQWIFFISIFFIVILWFVYSSKNLRNSSLNQNSILIIVSMAIGIFIGLFLSWFNKATDKFLFSTQNAINIAKKGDAGEKMVYLKLVNILDPKKYSIYKNYHINKTNFDFDFLVVGPKGLIVIEVKNSDYSYTFNEKEVIKIKNTQYSQETTKLFGDWDPRAKLIKRCKFLSYRLSLSGLEHIKTRKVLLFINSDIELKGKQTIFIIKHLNEISEYFKTLNEDGRYTEEFCRTLNTKLKSLE